MTCAYCGSTRDVPRETKILSVSGLTHACCAARPAGPPGPGPGFVPTAIQRGCPLDVVPERGVARVLLARGFGPVCLVNPHSVDLGGGARATTCEVVGVAV